MNENLKIKIEEIIFSGKSKLEKIFLIKKLLSEHDLVYVDLDDTITSNDTNFGVKLFYYMKIKRYSKQKSFELVMKDWKIFKYFFAKLSHLANKKLFIISRNDYDFIHYFIQNTKNVFAQNGFEIVGGIGIPKRYEGSGVFHIKSLDKILMIPDGSIIVSDVFEYFVMKNYSSYINVGKSSMLNWLYQYIKKINYTLKFLFFNK